MEINWFWILLLTVVLMETEGCLEQERVALLQLKSFFNDPSALSDWANIKGTHCCQWEGVECSNTSRRVIHLSLDFARQDVYDGYLNASMFLPFKELKSLSLVGNRIAGFVDNEGFRWLSRLGRLKSLDLSWNRLRSNILFHVAHLSSIKSLSLVRTQLKGSVTIKDSGKQVMINLEELDLSSNLLQNNSFAFISRLSNLKSLSSSANNLQGCIDIKEMNKLAKLKHLDLSSNQIQCLRSFEDDERVLELMNLEQLDLSNNILNNGILRVISGLSNLKSLNIGFNQVKCSINIKEFGTLKRLKFVELDGAFSDGNVSLFQVIQALPSVEAFSLSNNYFSKAISTQELENVSTNVQEISMYNSHLSHNTLQSIGTLTTLQRLKLSNSWLNGPLPAKGWCDLCNLKLLDLSGNTLEWSIPSCFNNLTSLRLLDISDNHIEVPSSFLSFANNSFLKYLFMDQIHLVSEHPFHIRTKHSEFQLKVFSMSNYRTKGLSKELPNFLYYQYDLRYLDLSNNNFGGESPPWLLENNTRLQQFLMSRNSFKGPLHLPKHANVDIHEVDMSNNEMQGQVPMNICSAFPHLQMFSLSRNAFEGNIPICLGGLKTLFQLDLSYNNFFGRILEELAKSSSLNTLILSNNNLSGKIPPSVFSSIGDLYLDGNNFHGEIPKIDISAIRSSTLQDIDLSNNHLSCKLPRWIWNVSSLVTLVLSNNHFYGHIPHEFCDLGSLRMFDLFSGSLPSCISSLTLQHLYLSRNRLSGPLPRALYNSSSLVTLDLSENNFTGKIPYWINSLSALSILLLKANHFEGRIPSQICQLNSLSIIDLSQNKLFGPIPSCLSNLSLKSTFEKSTMVAVLQFGGLQFGYGLLQDAKFKYNEFFTQPFDGLVEGQVVFTTKKGLYTYSGMILNYMTGIDLSCNRLTGQIPSEMGNLSELQSLNLSHNNFTGFIPSSFSMIKQIESLDLSYNKLSGIIPIRLMELNSGSLQCILQQFVREYST